MKLRLISAAIALSVSMPLLAGSVEEGKALSTQCSACHGKDGISRDPEAPNLAGQSAFYIEKQLVDYQKGIRQDRRMSLIAQSLDMTKIRNLAAYYAAFKITVTPPEL